VYRTGVYVTAAEAGETPAVAVTAAVAAVTVPAWTRRRREKPRFAAAVGGASGTTCSQEVCLRLTLSISDRGSPVLSATGKRPFLGAGGGT
jgi:hypothetical protein